MAKTGNGRGALPFRLVQLSTITSGRTMMRRLFIGAIALSLITFCSSAVGASKAKSVSVSSKHHVAKEVGAAQRKLKAQGLYTGIVDNVEGQRTFIAVRKYQSEHNLKATGRLDEGTLKKLGIK